MALLNWETGEVAFDGGPCFSALMPADVLDGRLRGMQETLWRSGLLKVSGGSLCAVGTVEDGVLSRLALEVCEANGKTDAAKARAFLFGALGLKDPCPDTLSGVTLKCAFGQVQLCSDALTGRTTAIICYGPAPYERS